MAEDWRNAFGILTCTGICDGAGVGICDDTPSPCSSVRFSLRCDFVNMFCDFVITLCHKPYVAETNEISRLIEMCLTIAGT